MSAGFAIQAHFGARASLADNVVGASPGGIAAFADAGDAWSGGALPNPLRLRSLGGELVADLTFPYDFPIRLRAGVARPLSDLLGRPAAARGYAVLGSDF